MPINLGAKAACLALAAATLAISFAPRADATPISYRFTVQVTSGPLSGTVENGSFSYDSSSILPGGGMNNAVGLLTSLDFTFNGATYNAGTANTGWLTFNAAGKLIDFTFGNHCDAQGCSVSRGSDDWFVRPGAGRFDYITPSATDSGSGSVSYAPLDSVPEPGELGMFGLGLLLLGVAGWRRSTAVRSAKC